MGDLLKRLRDRGSTEEAAEEQEQAPAVCAPQQSEHASHSQTGKDVVMVSWDGLARRLAI